MAFTTDGNGAVPSTSFASINRSGTHTQVVAPDQITTSSATDSFTAPTTGVTINNVLMADSNRRAVHLQNNDSTNKVYLAFGRIATADNGFCLLPNCANEFYSEIYTGDISAIAVISACVILITEFSTS